MSCSFLWSVCDTGQVLLMVTTDNVQLDDVTMHLHSTPSVLPPHHHLPLVYISQIVNWQLTYSQIWYALNQWVYKCFKGMVLALTLILAVSIQVKTGCCLWSSHLCLSTKGTTRYLECLKCWAIGWWSICVFSLLCLPVSVGDWNLSKLDI